jgi:hypothetical protein
MLTIFSTGKPFEGRAAMIQRNAITSWTLLSPRPEIILFGDEPGTAEVCKDLDLVHEPEVGRSEFGTPLVPHMFERAERMARGEIVCYVNCDIILMNDVVEGLRTILAWRGSRQFLAIGARWNAWVHGPIDFAVDWQSSLREAAEMDGGAYPWALDYFAFPRGLPRQIPPFVVGRPDWDNWMVYAARADHDPVIDLTRVTKVIHQRHDYGHHPDGRNGVYSGEEARRNMALAAGPHEDPMPAEFGLLDATHVVTDHGVEPAWRVNGLARWVGRQIACFPTFHPALVPPVKIARGLAHRIRPSRRAQRRAPS